MTKKIRRILFYIFLFVFLALVPLIIFFSRGYAFDFDKKIIVQTGGIYLKSIPEKAEIYIDDKLKGKTNKFVKRLIPKIYEVKVIKDGYHVWEKTLTVKRGIVTKADSIFLISNNPKIILNTEKRIDSFSILPNKKQIAYLSSNLFYIKDISGDDKIITTFKLNLPIKWTWSQDNKHVILESDNQYYFLNTEDPKVLINLSALIQNKSEYYISKIHNLSFGPDNKKIYFISKNNLYSFELKGSIVSDILVENVSNYTIYKKGILYLKNINKKIYELNLSTIESVEFFDQVFLEFDKGKWILSKDKKKLLCQKDKTIEILWLNEVFNNLSIRKKGYIQKIDLKENINNIIWHPKTDEHLIVSTDKEILIIELDNRKPQNIVRFIETEKSEIDYSIKYKKLYFLDKQKLYEVEL